MGPLQLRSDTRPTYRAEVRDVTITGIGLLTERSLAIGAMVYIERGPLVGLTTALSAIVCHATLRDDGRWLLGCRLFRYLTTDDMIRLG